MTSPEETTPVIDATDRFRAGRDGDALESAADTTGDTPEGAVTKLPIARLKGAMTRIDAAENPELATEYLRDVVAESIYEMPLDQVLKVAAFIQEEDFNA